MHFTWVHQLDRLTSDLTYFSRSQGSKCINAMLAQPWWHKLQASACSGYDLLHIQTNIHIHTYPHKQRQHFDQLIWIAQPAELNASSKRLMSASYICKTQSRQLLVVLIQPLSFQTLTACSNNWRQGKTVLYCLNPVSNFQVFSSPQYIWDWSCKLEILSCLRRRCEHASYNKRYNVVLR